MYNELCDLLIDDKVMRIITFFLFNHSRYYTRNDIIEMTDNGITKGSLVQNLPKLVKQPYNLLMVKNTTGSGFKQNNMRAYKLNKDSSCAMLLRLLLFEICSTHEKINLETE